MSRGLYQNAIYMGLMFFSLGQIEEWFISGKMLSASNGLNGTFALLFLFSFIEISQGSENQPKNGMDGVYNAWIFYSIMEFFRSMYLFFSIVFFSFLRLLRVYLQEIRSHNFPFLFLVIDFCLHLFQIPWSFSAKTNPEISVQVGMGALVLFEVQARWQNRFYHCRYYEC